MRLLLAAALLLALAACADTEATTSTNDPDARTWTPLFDGASLDGWQPKIRGQALGEDPANTFRVEDSMLVVRYDGYETFDEQFGHIFYETPFSHYIVATEYRFVGDQVAGGPGWALRNSGIMFHAQDPATMGRDQDFPISIEAQLLGGTGEGPRSTNNLCTPGTNVFMDGELFTQHCIGSSSATYDGDQWVRAEVHVLGDSLVTHVVEGDTVLQYTRPQIGGGNVDGFDEATKTDGTPLTEGYISLQSESHPVDFRKVELLNLKGCTDPEATNYKSYYVAADPEACEY